MNNSDDLFDSEFPKRVAYNTLDHQTPAPAIQQWTNLRCEGDTNRQLMDNPNFTQIEPPITPDKFFPQPKQSSDEDQSYDYLSAVPQSRGRKDLTQAQAIRKVMTTHKKDQTVHSMAPSDTGSKQSLDLTRLQATLNVIHLQNQINQSSSETEEYNTSLDEQCDTVHQQRTRRQTQANETFELKKSIALKMGYSLENEYEVEQLHPHASQQTTLDMLRVIGIFVFSADLTLKYVYPFHSIFASADIYSCYTFILWTRVTIIVCFHTYQFLIDLTAALISQNRQMAADAVVRVVCLPVCMFAGLYRFLSNKIDYYNIGLLQELWLHQCPLLMLAVYNTVLIPRFVQTYDYILFACAGLHLIQVTVEYSYFKFYLDKGINLDVRIFKPKRLKYIKLAVLAVALTVTCLLLGLLIQKPRSCFGNQYAENKGCVDCSTVLTEQCNQCDGPSQCLQCKPQSYLFRGKCLACSSQWSHCETCTTSQCTQCKQGFYLDNFKCHECSLMQGCVQNKCGLIGCTQCMRGYFKRGAVCVLCSQYIPGCTSCNSQTDCTECGNSFLQVTQQACMCNPTINMLTAQDGSCVCQQGFYMTSVGCLSCQQTITNCNQCIIGQNQTQFQVFTGASLTAQPVSYYDCSTCGYNYFRTFSNNTVACQSCESKWQGCAYCGPQGQSCIHCLNSYVWQINNATTPCRKQ